MRIVSLLPAATEIVGALGLMDELVGISHECDFPPGVGSKARVLRCPIHEAGLSSAEIDQWVRATLAENGTLYQLDEELLRTLQPDIILTQALCDVCAVGYGSVAKLAAHLPGPVQVVNLEPVCLADVWENIRAVARVAGVPERGETTVARLQSRVEAVRAHAENCSRPRCYLMEWADPPFSAGHWNPELVEFAGGHEALGKAGQRSLPLTWEAVLQAQPEVMVLALCGFGVERALQDLPLLRAYPGWKALPAVRSGRVYAVDGSAYFSRPGPRLVEGLEILAGLLHPGIFPQFAPQRWRPDQVIRLGEP